MDEHPHYKWYLLGLASLTSAFTIGAPAMCLAVLFNEISADLHLNLVQMAWLWSIGSLPAIFTSPLSGALDDRFGPKKVMLAGVFLVAVAAGLRGLASSFVAMLLIIILIGILVPLVSTSAFKIIGLWFPSRHLGLANGILTMGLSFGFLIGSFLSANVLSPWLGGWRQVIFLYAGAALLFCIPWYFTLRGPEPVSQGLGPATSIPMQAALKHIARQKNLWLLGIAIMGVAGCMQGVVGYLSLFLRGKGWPPFQADGALAILSLMSLIFIVPLTLWSDRLGARKNLALGMALALALASGTLSIANGLWVWAAVILAGIVKDASTSLLITMGIESEGVGPVYAGTASGFILFFMFIGNLLSPPLGNPLAEISPGLPFVFWAGLAVLGVLSLLISRGSKHTAIAETASLSTEG